MVASTLFIYSAMAGVTDVVKVAKKKASSFLSTKTRSKYRGNTKPNKFVNDRQPLELC